MRPIFFAVIVTILAMTPAGYAQTSDRIKYDKQCFIIDGKDTFLYSGSLHYFRCPKPLWSDRLQRMKDAGFNCVETYVAWNWHEQSPPADVNDFSKVDMTDLTDFLDLAINKYGLYVILRPGPYICAEWDGGGYPQWLLTKKPATVPAGGWYRSDDPQYLAWCKHWMTAVAKVVVPYQITHEPSGKTGVILWQIENEYNYDHGHSSEHKLNQLLSLAHDSREAGIDVPLITCMTDDQFYAADPFLKANVIECRNTYPRMSPTNEAKDITWLETYQPDKPRMVTELQGGWFSELGGKLSDQQGFDENHLTHVTLVAWAHGFTGTNYYMGYGGTNMGDWGSSNKTTTYDYDAPIREWGGVGPRYFAAEGMAAFVKEHGAELARSELDPAKMVADGMDVFVRETTHGSRFVFLINNTTDKRGPDATVMLKDMTVHYDLPPFGAKILYLPRGATDASKGEWYPTPGAPPQRPTNVPSAIQISDLRTKVDPGPEDAAWRDLPDGASIEDMGIYDRRFVFYRTQVKLDAAATLSLLVHRQDGVLVQLGDHLLESLLAGTAGRRGGGGSPNKTFHLPTSSGMLNVLYEDGGRPNGGIDMENTQGLHDVSLKSGDSAVATHWQIADHSVGSANKWFDPVMDDSSWESVKVGATDADPITSARANLVWYRMNVALPAADPHVWVPWKLHLEQSGNGFLYLNGHFLGRVWEIGPQTDYYLPECWLNFGPGAKNNVTLCLRAVTGAPTVKAAVVQPYADFAETR